MMCIWGRNAESGTGIVHLSFTTANTAVWVARYVVQVSQVRAGALCFLFLVRIEAYNPRPSPDRVSALYYARTQNVGQSEFS